MFYLIFFLFYLKVYGRDRVDSYEGKAFITHKSFKIVLVAIDLTNCDTKVFNVKMFNCKILKNVISINTRSCRSCWAYLFLTFSKKSIITGKFQKDQKNK